MAKGKQTGRRRAPQSDTFCVTRTCANGVVPQSTKAKMKEEKKDRGYTFPYLYDESQSVAKNYRAACTPDFFLFDAERRLVYRGQMDDSRPDSSIPVTGTDLCAALDAAGAGRPGPAEQKPSLGCNIKWKPDNEPDYAL